MKYYVIYERALDGGWGAYAPDLPGVGVVGASQDEVRELVRTAIALHVQGLREDGMPVPEPSAQAGELLEVA